MAMSNFPNGFQHGLTVRNQPILSTHSGTIFWVGKTPEGQAGSNGYDGTYNWPFATIDFAIGKCTANHGDIIVVKAGHTESITGAAGIAADVAGVSIIGLGSGADRPTITFSSTDNSATFTITAASITIENIIGVGNDDALTTGFSVTGSDCWLDIEWQDTSATVEAARAVTATTVSRFYCKLKYVGFITGNACVNAIRLVEVTGARILVDAYGEFSTGVVEMVTTASTDVLVSGYFYNDNAALTKNVVNTGGLACTWYAYGYDGKGGYSFSGGSAIALAADDVSSGSAVPSADNTDNTFTRDVIGNKSDAAASGAVTATDTITAYVKQLVTELAVVDGYFDVPTADAAPDTTMRDVVGRKTDAAVAAVTTNKSLMGYVKGLLNSSVQRKMVISDALVAADITGTATRFTISGGPIRVLTLGAWVSTALPAGANTMQFGYTPAGGAGANTLSGATDTASAGADQLFLLDGVKATGPVKTTDVGVLAGGQLLVSTPVQGVLLAPGTISTIFSAGPPATGAITVFMEYEPMTPSAAVA
jgi:hypothetical protein